MHPILDNLRLIWKLFEMVLTLIHIVELRAAPVYALSEVGFHVSCA